MAKLFQLSIREKPLYLFGKYFAVILVVPFLWSLFGRMSVAGMRPVGEISVPIGIKSLPFISREETPEFQDGPLLGEESLGIQNIEPVSTFVVPEFLQGSKESTLKISGGPVEFSNSPRFFVSALGKEMIGKSNYYATGNGTDRKTSEFNWHDFLLGMMAVITA